MTAPKEPIVPSEICLASSWHEWVEGPRTHVQRRVLARFRDRGVHELPNASIVLQPNAERIFSQGR